MDRRLLIGVTHFYERQDVENVLSCLRENEQPLRVGIELPDDYKEREDLRIGFPTFTKLVHYFIRTIGPTIIPLDETKLSDERFCTKAALGIIKNETQKKFYEEKTGLEQHLAGMIGYAAPESTLTLVHYIKRFRRVAELIEETNQDQLQKRFDDLVKASDKVMIERIIKHDPEIVVVGGAHARNIITSLPRYRYLQFATF